MPYLLETNRPLRLAVFSLRIACYTLELSILRGILRYEPSTSHKITQYALQIMKNAMDTLAKMGESDKDGLWPSCKFPYYAIMT